MSFALKPMLPLFQEWERRVFLLHLQKSESQGIAIHELTTRTYNTVFEELAASMEECLAECVAAYLVFESQLLASFGYTENREVESSLYQFFRRFMNKSLNIP